jgi:hypothetical protein
MKVDKQEFAWQFSQASCPGQTRTRAVAWELRSESLHESFSTLMSRSNENKSCMRVDESWEARVCMRAFSTLMSRSNENKSCTRVHDGWEAIVCMRVFSTLMPRSNENKSCTRVHDGWEAIVCMRVFSALMPGWANENLNVDESWLTVKRGKRLVNGRQKLNQLKVDESTWVDLPSSSDFTFVSSWWYHWHHCIHLLLFFVNREGTGRSNDTT